MLVANVSGVVIIKCDLLVFKEEKCSFDAVLKGSDKRSISRLGSVLIINSCFLNLSSVNLKPGVTMEAVRGPTSFELWFLSSC